MEWSDNMTIEREPSIAKVELLSDVSLRYRGFGG